MSEWVRLGDVAELISGRDLESDKYNEMKKGIPYITGASNFTDGCISFNRWTDTPVTISKYNDILITCKGTVGEIAINTFGDCHIARQIMAIRVNESLILRSYLKYAIKNLVHILKSNARSMIPGISRCDILSINIPNIPKVEQQHIVSVLDSVNSLIDARKKQIALLDEAEKSLFVEMFGDPVENPKGWEYTIIENICENIVDCPHSTPQHSDIPSPYPSIRTTDIRDGRIIWDSMKYVSKSEFEKRVVRLVPKKDDLIYAREGSFGDAVLLPGTHHFSLGQRVMLLRAKASVCTPIFLWSLVRSEYVYNQALQKNVGSTVGHINVGDIKKFKVPLPPLSLQKEFAARISSIEEHRREMETGLQQMEEARSALMQQYFG